LSGPRHNPLSELASRFHIAAASRPPRNVQGNVVLFGWSPTRSRVMGWVWRSETNFELEVLPDGGELHPAAPGTNLNGSQEDWLATGLEQQAWTEAGAGKRYIGGRLIAHQIIRERNSGAIVQSQILGKFVTSMTTPQRLRKCHPSATLRPPNGGHGARRCLQWPSRRGE
jgi:hypothetical protein